MPNKPKKIDNCAYCGKLEPATKDHIPPRNLFPEPRSHNLITVPCCESCRQGWSKDDEYFRLVLLSTWTVSEQEIAQKPIDTLIRSLGRKENRKFARMVQRSMGKSFARTEAGILLGPFDTLSIQPERVNRVLERIIRGLFFHEKKYPVPEGYRITIRFNQLGLDKILGMLTGVHFHEIKSVQDSIFTYSFKESEVDTNSIVWLLMFYGIFIVPATTISPWHSDLTIS